MSYLFGDFELDPERRQLLRAATPVPLEPKAYELLCLLVERRPRALSRAQIRDAIWPGTFISESTLGVVVNGLRQALGDDAKEPRSIRTVRGFGYAFCGEVRESTAERPETGKAPAAPGVEARESPAEAPASGRSVGTPARLLRMSIIAAGLVVLVVAGWLAIRRARPSGVTTNVVEPRAVPLTSLPGVELHPALSPDGTRVAFIWHGPDRDNFDVYVKDLTSGQMVRVTQDPAPDYRPVWSPAGKHIAFLRAQENGLAVFLVSPSGGHEMRLRDIAQPLTLWHRDPWSTSVDWSPDGRFLAVTDRATDSTWGIAIVSVETGGKQSLTANPGAAADLYPAFSPDGRRLAFFRGNVNSTAWDLHIQALSSEEPPRARGDAAVIKGVDPGLIAWLPSGDELLVGRQRVALDGSPVRPSLPGWSAIDGLNLEGMSVRGAKLVLDNAEARKQLLRLPLAGATKAPLVPFFPSTQGEMAPAFAPDGRRVAFTSWRSGDGHIWIGEADGSACRELPLPPESTYASSPSWSPDGRRLAFDAVVGGTDHVYIATPEGGTLRRLMSERTPGARPRWSRDGRFVYFASTRSGGSYQLWKVRADAGDPEAEAVEITRSGGMEAEESPDGRFVYYAKRSAPGVFRLPLQAQAPPEERVLDIGGEGLWRLTAHGILVLDVRIGHPPTIRFHDLATRVTSVVLEVPLAPEWDIPTLGGAFTVSPDERWALIGTHQIVESDIMLLDGFR